MQRGVDAHFARGMRRFWAWSVNFTPLFDTWVPECRRIRPLLKRKSPTPRAKHNVRHQACQEQWRARGNNHGESRRRHCYRHCSRAPPPLFSKAAAIDIGHRRHCTRPSPPLFSVAVPVQSFKLQTSDPRRQAQPQISEPRPQTPDLRTQTSDTQTHNANANPGGGGMGVSPFQ